MKLKLPIYTLLAVALSAEVSCNKSEPTPPPMPVGGGPFEVSVSDITFRNARVKVVPEDANLFYYDHVLPKASFSKNWNNDVDRFLAEYWQVLSEERGMKIPDIIAKVRVKGNDDWEYPYLEADTEYVVFAVGLDDQGLTTTKPAFKEFTSEKPGPLETVDCTFEFEVTNIAYTSADVKIIPSDNYVPYFYSIIKAAEWDGASDKKSFMSELYRTAINSTMEGLGQTYTETIFQLRSMGPAGGSLQEGALKTGTEYVVLAFGVDDYERATTEPGVERFSTPAVDPSTNTFTITITEPSATDVKYEIGTSNYDPYYTTVLPKETIGGLNDEQLISMLEERHQIAGDFEGPDNFSARNKLIPDTEYQIIAVGYNLAVTTAVTRKEFRTLKGGDPAACSFDVTITPDIFSMMVKVTPSDATVFYFTGLYKVADYVSDEALTKDFQGFLERECEKMNAPMSEALLNIARRGEWDGEYATESLMEYYIVAYALNMDGSAAGQVYKEEYTAPERIVSDAVCELEYSKYYNGADLYAYDPLQYPFCVDWDGNPMAYVPTKVIHNDAAVEWYAALMAGEILDLSDAGVIENLIDYGAGQHNTEELVYNVCYFSDLTYSGATGLKAGFVAVALDKDGNYGPIFREEFAPTTDGVSPISDLIGTNPAVASHGLREPVRPVVVPAEKSSLTSVAANRTWETSLPQRVEKPARQERIKAPVIGVRPAVPGVEADAIVSSVSRSAYGSGRAVVR